MSASAKQSDLLSSGSKVTLGLICCVLLLVLSSDLQAARRSLRIDFGAWDDGQALGTPDCPGSFSDQGLVIWKGFNFNGSFFDVYNVDAYCQSAVTFDLNEDDYLNSTIFPSDESGLAAKIGDNDSAPFITGIRYTFLDGDRFEETTRGFQWAFYSFPNGITLVALYGEIPTGSFSFEPSIYEDDTVIWDGIEDGYDGEYFCFNSSAFIGFWDGGAVGSSPAAGCVLPPPPEVIFEDGLEELEEE